MRSIPTRWMVLGGLLLEIALAWHVFSHFERFKDAVPEPLRYLALLIPAALFAAAVAALEPRPLAFALRALLIALGALLLVVFGLWGVDQLWGDGLGPRGRLGVNLALALLAPVLLLALLRGPYRGAALTLAVALLYAGLSSVAYLLQYGPGAALLQPGFAPLWACWVGLLLWHPGGALVRRLRRRILARMIAESAEVRIV